MLSTLNDRSRTIFRHIVDAYMETGQPVGSRTIAKALNNELSAASIRNVMADLEDMGLLHAPHTSAGRLPTDLGLRLFVDGVIEIGDLSQEEQLHIDAECAAKGRNFDDVMNEASGLVSGLSGCASLVYAPKADSPLKHIEFVNLSPGRTLVIMVSENGVVENRVIATPPDIPASALVQASNYLGAKMVGQTLSQGTQTITDEIQSHRDQLDQLSRHVVESGLAQWVGEGDDHGSLIVRGQAYLLDDVAAVSDLERIRTLFQALETKETLLKLLDLADHAEGVQIFIGSDNPLFRVSGCSMVVAPFRDGHQKIIGAIGVIGPTRINYARIIPMVDYTSKVISRLLG